MFNVSKIGKQFDLLQVSPQIAPSVFKKNPLTKAGGWADVLQHTWNSTVPRKSAWILKFHVNCLLKGRAWLSHFSACG